MTTFQMTVTIISLVVSVLTALGLGTIMKHFWDDKHERAKASRQEAKEERARERAEEIRGVLRQELQVVKEDLHSQMSNLECEIGHIKEGVEKLQTAVDRLQTSLIRVDRILMKSNLDSYRNQGYASPSDRAAWNELYQDYKDLGGNHFKEYVNEWKSTLESLPKEKSEETHQ